MKKLLVFMLVLGLASLANATVIDVIVDGIGDSGNAGTSGDPLVSGESIYVDFVLNNNPYAGFASYDGYLLSAMDLNLHVSTNGTLDVDETIKGVPIWDENANWTFTGSPTIASNVLDTGPYASTAGIDGAPDDVMLLGGMYITASGTGALEITLTWSLNSPPGQYADYKSPAGGPYPAGSWQDFVVGDLGGLTIYQVPEPATIALLGLGGLFLSRRRKR